MERSETILIVDDEPINLDFFEVMLSKLGFDVCRASDGEEGLQQALDMRPDLIVVDNIMPRMTGWEMTRALKNDAEYETIRDVPVIMFSAMDDVKDKIEGFELGVEDYITKPFNFSEVLARIKAVLRHREMAEQVVRRERRIAVTQSLNKSLVYFTEKLREPMIELRARADTLPLDDRRALEEFVSEVKREADSTIAALDALQSEIDDLTRQGDEIREEEVTVEVLDRKYRERFETGKKPETDGNRG